MQGIEIRNNDIQKNISAQAGIYRWYMSEALAAQLNVPIKVVSIGKT